MRAGTRFFLLSCSVAFVFASPALAAPIVSLGTSATIAPGGSLSLNVTLNSASPFNQLELFLRASANSPASGFKLTGQTSTWNGPTTNPLTSPNTADFPPNYFLPTSGNSIDLGYGTADQTTNLPAGQYNVETLTFSAAPSIAPGVYSISTTTGLIGTQLLDAAGDNTSVPQATFTVTVSPEPASVLLLCAAPLIVPRRRSLR